MTKGPLILTVDVEDYFMSPETISPQEWDSFDDRVEIGLNFLLSLLARTNNTATFFYLGYVAERHPEIVKRTVAEGHEVGTHNYWHLPYDQLGPEKFKQGLKRSVDIIEVLTGRKVIGHRAPMWSVKTDMKWVFEGLREVGIQYDSSLFPFETYLYGDAGANPEPHWIQLSNDRLLEVPASTRTFLGKRFPVGGGFFLRLYPGWLTRQGINQRLRCSQSVVLYVHPWELDKDHPRPDMPWKQAAIHGLGLSGMREKMKKLTERYRFVSMEKALDRLKTLANGGENA